MGKGLRGLQNPTKRKRGTSHKLVIVVFTCKIAQAVANNMHIHMSAGQLVPSKQHCSKLNTKVCMVIDINAQLTIVHALLYFYLICYLIMHF
jgi:hypothetical protein